MRPLTIRIVTIGMTVFAVSSMFAPVAMAGLRMNRCETFIRDERK